MDSNTATLSASAGTGTVGGASGKKNSAASANLIAKQRSLAAAQKEVSHYVVTAYPSGVVLTTCKCNFISPKSFDVLIAKPRRIEIRQFQTTADDERVNESATGGAGAGDAATPFPVVLQLNNVHGNIIAMEPIRNNHNLSTTPIFLLQERFRYAVIQYNASSTPYPITTHASGSLASGGNSDGSSAMGGGFSGSSSTGSSTHIHSIAHLTGRIAETGPIVSVDPEGRCIALHLYDGLLTIIPINPSYVPPSSASTGANNAKSYGTTKSSAAAVAINSSMLGEPFHCRIEERTVLAITFLHTSTYKSPSTVLPLICILWQDSRNAQHITSHAVNLRKKQLHLNASQSAPLQTPWVKKSAVDGGSSILISVPPVSLNVNTVAASAPSSASTSSGTVHAGSIVILGQRQFSIISGNSTKIVPVPQGLYLTYDRLPDDPSSGCPRYLIGDEFGNLHMLSIVFVVPTSSASSSLVPSTVLSGVTTSFPHPRVVALQLETLGSCTVSSSLAYLEHGLCFVGSAMGDSQLVQIHDEPTSIATTNPATIMTSNVHDEADIAHNISLNAVGYESHNKQPEGVPEDVVVDLMDTTYISVVEEYTNLGPILDFDLVPTTPGSTTQGGAATSTSAAISSGTDQRAGTTSSRIMSSSSTGHQHQHQQSQVVTASGTSKSGTIRVIRNGIGMNEYASVEMAGIQAMWSIRKSFRDSYDTYLVQSFVGETRVLGVVTSSSTRSEEMMITENDDNDNVENSQHYEDEEAGGTLEEVLLIGLESSTSTLYVGNVQQGDRLLQITESEVLLIANNGGGLLDSWSGNITVAAANEAGQIVVAMAGGSIVYLRVIDGQRIALIYEKQMDREVSCIDLHPFAPKHIENKNDDDPGSAKTEMDIDHVEYESDKRSNPCSTMLAVGLWDLSVRLLSLEKDKNLEELICIHLSTTEDDEDKMDTATSNAATTTTESTVNQRRNRNNMMARSLCLITLDFPLSSSTTSPSLSSPGTGTIASNICYGNYKPGVNMLFVGLGDGNLISFAVVESLGVVSVQSKKEVCLGTQCIHLVPLNYSFSDQPHHQGGTCILATGDRPTVIYLAGVGGVHHNNNSSGSTHTNPKLCYSNVNVAAGDNEEEGGISRPPSHQAIVVNVATPFYSPLLFGGISAVHGSHQQYSLCVADDASLRLGVIDDIQKLHVTTCRLGMVPKRIVHCPEGRLFAVGCIESGIKQFGFGGNLGGVDESNMGNCIRFMDDTTFDDLERVDLEPYEMILSMEYATMKVPAVAGGKATGAAASNVVVTGERADISAGVRSCYHFKPFLFVGTGYALPDEDEPTRGRILVYSCQAVEENSAGTGAAGGRVMRVVTEFSVEGGVYSMTQFYDGLILASVNSRTHMCRLVQEDAAGCLLKLQYVGNGHFGHILSLFVKSRAKQSLPMIEAADASMDLSSDQDPGTGNNEKDAAEGNASETKEEMLAIVGDLLRSISLVQYYPQYQTLEEIARDFNVNWTTAVEMLTDNIYLGAENWNNLFCLRRNTASSSEEVQCRLDTIGEYHLGEMCNKFMSGSLVMPVSSNVNTASKSSTRRGRTSTPSKKSDTASPSKTGSGSTASRIRRPVVVTGSQTLFGTASGTLGVVLGMDNRTAAFFSTLEQAMANPKVIRPIGDFLHAQYRACHAERRIHPAHGFVDGDLVESFLDLDRNTMEAVVTAMNRDGGWELFDDCTVLTCGNVSGQEKDDNKDSNMTEADDRSELTVEDVVALVEEMTMLH